MSEHAVLKFGGSSILNPEVCADIFLEDPNRNQIAVVSGVGKDRDNPDDPMKVTDWLDKLETAVSSGDEVAVTEAQDAVIAKQRRAFNQLSDKALNSFDDVAKKLMDPANSQFGYGWIGEHLSARMFAILTGATYVGTGLLFSEGSLQVSKSLKEIRKKIGSELLRSGSQVVTEGYYGHDSKTGQPVTLPRGGSDISGVIYTGAFNSAEQRWVNLNYTDKDGILSADPDIVPGAKVIPEMTMDEVREKMHGVTERNGVVHGDAIVYASRLGVEMIVMNTFNRDAISTRIVSARQSDPDHPIVGISGKSNVTAMSVYDMGMADAKNYLARILARVGRDGLSISNIPTGEDRIKLIFNSGVGSEDLEDVETFIRGLAISRDKVEIETVHNQGAIYLIGQELTKAQTYTETIGRVAILLAGAGLGIREVISHEKSPSLALTVDGPAVTSIIQLLHTKLVEESS